MSQGLKLRYDQLREGDPTKDNASSSATNENEFYLTPGHARNLCLVWPGGKRMFLNYAYLISGELALEGEKNTITLNFSSHSLLLKGFSLEPLFIALLDHFPRFIMAMNTRYVSSDNSAEAIVTDIFVEKKET